MRLPVFRVFNLFNIVLLILAMMQFYYLRALNSWTESLIPPLSSLSFGFDSLFSQTPVFVIPYVSVYLLFALLIVSIAWKRNIIEMSKFLFSVLLLWSLLNFLQIFLPINNQYPQLSDSGSFLDYFSVVARPYRTLPRWHITTAILCAIAFTKIGFKNSKYVILWSILICLSPAFLKMTFIIEILFAVPLPFLCYFVAEKISAEKIKVETVQEVVKTFTLESLIQSVCVGIRDQNTLSSLIDGLSRVEKSLSDEDREKIIKAGSEIDPPTESLKKVINDLILSISVKKQLDKARKMFGNGERAYTPADTEIKSAAEELINSACKPFMSPEFRDTILETKRRNSQLINSYSVEKGARDRSAKVINKFKGFIETHKKNIPALESIVNTNGNIKYHLEEIKTILHELRKPPYELSADEIWNACYRTDNENVKPISEFRVPANIISLIRYATGKIEKLEPYNDKVERRFKNWLEENESKGRKFSEEEKQWLQMMKNYFCSSLEINVECFEEPPFTEKGGTSGVYKIFGQDLERIISDFNEKLI